ncbi:pilus assembly protein PilM [Planctomycetota bacterium]|jgi:type IV pilus assembly protein PilM|nr:type IV pilus assembly protein PilM [Planctomycetota bacterium]MSR39322.1 type IV pilus assembly protein PilM [Planctomycetota bacterium]GDY01032.1 pilus assembly protein PilM [Planctomycetota bacterium]
MLKQRKSIVGLDIGSSCIKAVEITQDKYDYVITGYAQTEVPDEQGRHDAIAELFRAGKFRTKRVATAVSGKSVIFRYINMPDVPDEKLLQAIRFEADKYIPFDVNEVELDAQKLMTVDGEGGKSEAKVLLVAAKKTILEDHTRMLADIGLQPISVGIDGFALGNAWELADLVNPGVREAGRTVALIDIGATKSSINILRNSVSCFAREVTMGGNELTQAIIRRLGIEANAAEALKRDPGDQMSTVQDAVGQVLEDLGNEINLSFDFFENQFDGEVDEVLLTGGSVLLPFLEESLEKIFEKRTRVWNPVEGLKVKSDSVDVEALNQFAPQLAVAIGLAAAT